jgi:hypothetical protein
LTKYDVHSSSTSSSHHANIIEENTRLKNDLAKSSIPIGEKNLNDLLSNQRSNNVKTRLSYVSKAKKKKKQEEGQVCTSDDTKHVCQFIGTPSAE